MISAILTDIEGTTSSLSFVKDMLFPYARKHLPAYVRAHESDLADIFNDIRSIESDPNLGVEDIISRLLQWIDEDRKVTPLKMLQGMIWKEGYKKGDLKGHIYEDAVKSLQRWRHEGLALYIYSSGSVEAQKLLFSHTPYGDLTPLFSGYFDTNTGSKIEPDSYKKIAAETGLMPGSIMFLSDNTKELDAANAAGFHTILVNRPQDLNADPGAVSAYVSVEDFYSISLKEKAA
ncbi:MAG TPA: acireductone synthase [Rhodospirillaceae bacterium]|nr:acireductone synthase [Rhodospirillaceae bacterium]